VRENTMTLKLIVAVAGFAVLGNMASPAQSGSNSDPNSTLGTADLNHSTLQSSAESTAITDRYLTPVKTELSTKVDSKNAVVGQEVDARIIETTKLADGTTLPKGTKLAGRVTQVQPMANGGGRSTLAMSFDHAELKGGKTIQVRCVIQMLAPPTTISMTNSAMEPIMPGEPIGVVPPTRGGSGVGTNSGSRSGGRTASVGPGTAAQTSRGTLDPMTPSEGGAVASAGETVSTAPKPTQLPGVMLSTAGAAYTSGTLTASGRNVTLESGTRITLGVIAR
jgi:hypothetical protein